MKRASAIAIGLLLFAGSAKAAILGVDLDYPDILSNTTGAYSYNSGTELFSSTATALTIVFNKGGPIIPIKNGSYSAQFKVDNNTGQFLSGVAGDDLVITGDIDVNGDNVNEYSGELVVGEVTDFGWDSVSSSFFLFDFEFDFKRGALSSFYAGASNKGGDIALAESSNFRNWSTNHGSTDKTKHDTAPIPEPATALLMAVGLAGAAGARRYRSRKP